MDPKQWALLCAAIHHGLGNLSKDSKPARADTIVNTAKAFEEYLQTPPSDTAGWGQRP